MTVINNVLRIVCVLVHIAASLWIFLRMVRVLRKKRGSEPCVLFIFAALTYMMSSLYWLAFVLMNQAARVPFMPSEIADDGELLLFGATILSVFRNRRERTVGLAVVSTVFAVANAALWGLWSGEWVKDIIGAFPFGIMVYGILRALKLSGAFSKRDQLALGIISLLLLVLQYADMMVKPPLSGILGWVCYGILLAGIGWFWRKFLCSRRGAASPEACLALAFGTWGWTISALYMSAEPAYFAMDLLLALAAVCIQRTLERQVCAV